MTTLTAEQKKLLAELGRRTSDEAQKAMASAMNAPEVQAEAHSLTLEPEQLEALEKMDPVERAEFFQNFQDQGATKLLDRRNQTKLADSLSDGELVMLSKMGRRQRRAFLAKRRRELKKGKVN